MKLNQLNEAFERLGEEKIYKDISPDFNIDDIEGELDKRRIRFEELVSKRSEVENHYIERFKLDLFIIKRMLKEDIEDLDTTDKEAVKEFFNNLDFRIKHAEQYVGLPD